MHHHLLPTFKDQFNGLRQSSLGVDEAEPQLTVRPVVFPTSAAMHFPDVMTSSDLVGPRLVLLATSH